MSLTAQAATESSKLIAGDGASGDEFGSSISMDGDRIIVGAWEDDDNGSDSGSAYTCISAMLTGIGVKPN